MLSTRVKSITDLMSIALQAEREAMRRYAQLAADMRAGGNQSAAALFERMVTEEQQHERQLLAWMARESIVENTAIGPIHWRDPEARGRYEDEARNPHFSTPYRALAFAVNNEEIAFRFYTQVAAEAEDEAVRRCAENLAREELAHAALLRAERRRAYHAERKSGATRPDPDPRDIRNEAQMLTVALSIDRYLADALRDISADESPLLDALRQATLRQISDNEKALETLSPATAESTVAAMAVDFEKLDPGDPGTGEASNRAQANLDRLETYCDRSFVLYDAIVATTADEAVLHTAQRLASSALDRISLLKQTS